jgi:hypothetical protein
MSASNFGLAYTSKGPFQSNGLSYNRHCFALTRSALRGAPAAPCDPAASPCCAKADGSAGPQQLTTITIQTSGCRLSRG